MTDRVADHYTQGGLLDAIRAGLRKQGLTPQTVTVDALAAVDAFHMGGRSATAALMEQLAPSDTHHLLDLGCGLGGAARYVASRYGCRVTGIDLTPAFVDAGQALCRWVGLDHRIALFQGDVLALPFEPEAFDGAYMLHVGMNVADKERLCREVSRVLRPGACFGIYDIVHMTDQALAYPVPWAAHAAMNQASPAHVYTQALERAGLRLLRQRNRRDAALAYYERLRAAGPPTVPALGLHLVMGASTKIKIRNMLQSLAAGAIAPMEFIAQKPSS